MRRKAASLPVVTAEVVPAEQVPARQHWAGWFMGALLTNPGGPLVSGPEQALLVLGPPRSGKAPSVVVPTVRPAPGAVVTTSTKDDVVAWTAKARSLRGRTWLFDPSGTVAPGTLTPLRWSPLAGCERWSVAMSRAHA